VAGSPFSWAVFRLVPRVDRGERINVGVVLFSRPRDYLRARTGLDEERARALWPGFDSEPVRRQLEALERIAAGEPDGGPIAELDPTARFHWLVSPSSTVVQPSAVHTGACGDLDAELEKLFRAMVEPPAPDEPAPA
jgi:Protein of unknown function (DUF3037)